MAFYMQFAYLILRASRITSSASTGPQRHDLRMRQDLDNTTIKKKKKNLIQLISLAGVQSQNCDSQT